MENKIWEYRKKKGMTLQELSRRTGIATSTIWNLENQMSNDILLSNADALAKVLGVDIYELFCVNYPSPKGNGLLRALRLYLRSLIAYAILILIGVSTSPLLYRALRLTTLLLRIIFNAPFTSALRYLPTLVLYIPLCIRLPLN